MGFGLTARPLRALKAVSSSVARNVSMAEVMRVILASCPDFLDMSTVGVAS
jgi:hypothetical protein